MENLVTTLNTAKKLKEAGWGSTDPVYYWCEADGIKPHLHPRVQMPEQLSRGIYPAPGAQEIADHLKPHVLEKHFYTTNDGAKHHWFYRASTTGAPGKEADGDTMAEALAQLWLKLNAEGK